MEIPQLVDVVSSLGTVGILIWLLYVQSANAQKQDDRMREHSKQLIALTQKTGEVLGAASEALRTSNDVIRDNQRLAEDMRQAMISVSTSSDNTTRVLQQVLDKMIREADRKRA